MKKKRNVIILMMIIFFVLVSPIVVTAGEQIDYTNLCSDFNSGIGAAFRILGYVVVVIKWIAPLIIMVLGMVDFSKAVLENDDKAINKAASTLLRRFIAGVAIFLAPTFVLAILNAVGVTNDIEGMKNTNRYSECTKCLLNANKYCSIFESGN